MKQRILLGIAVGSALVAVLWVTRSEAPPSDAFFRLMNQGKGHIENRESDEAIKTLTKAVALNGQSAAALRNLARAHLILKRAEHCQAALDLLTRASAIDPNSAATQYLTGLALVGLERYEDAVPFFERAVRLDPDTAALRYQLASALQTTGDLERAYEQFMETIRIEPMHTNAIYKLASYARRHGDRDEVMRLTREFQRLKKLFGLQPEDFFQRCTHLNPESGVEASNTKATGARVIPVRWRDATGEVFGDNTSRSASAAAVLEVDATGVVTVFVASPDGEMSVISMGSEGTFERRVVRAPSGDGRRFTCCTVGDFYVRIPDKGPDKFTPRYAARNDVFLLGSNGARLLERADDATFVDRTPGSGLAGATGHIARAVDYDHNGVLDLFIARDGGLELWQNNSYVVRIETANRQGHDVDDGLRFVNVTEEAGLTAAGPAYDVSTIDIDANVATDIIVARGEQPTLVSMNQRAGRFAPMPEPPGPWPPATRVLVNDLDNDGHPDAVLIGEDHAVVMRSGKVLGHRFAFDDLTAAGGVLIDYDNDGWLDFCAFGGLRDTPDRGGLRFWRNLGAGGWSDASNVVTPPIVDAVPADYDNDGDTDLLLVTADDELRLLVNDGGNANRQLKLRLISILTNPTGLGNTIEVRAGNMWLTRFVNKLPIEIGVGQATELDTVLTQWTNGVVDNEFLVSPTTKPLEFTEKMVELGSCPFLLALAEDGFRFVTDILGNAPLGLSIRRDEVLQADPDEIVYVGKAEDLAIQDGAYVLEIAECYREVLYLDSAKLIAVDHPPGVEVHPTDKLMPPPFPDSELWALGNPVAAIRVESDDGVDRTSDIHAIDDVYAPPGPTLPPPFRGLCQPVTLTMDFGTIDVDQPLVLALTGWLRYGSASVNIAISQNPALTIIPPTLEVETNAGVWKPVDVVVGMPAGKTKTIVCDLTGKLPRGARRLRLTSTFEIRWDRIALCTRLPLPESTVHELIPTDAELRWRGFPEMASRGPQYPITPDFDAISERPMWRTTPQGWCTRYGDVLELVGDADGRVVIVNGGDAVTLRFSADDLPPIPHGMTRSFFFRSVGWEKDADHNVVDGDTVEPLPGGDGPGNDWRLEYNTRWVDGDVSDTGRR